MNTTLILQFLRDITENNKREWFLLHHDEYLAAREEFERHIPMVIGRIAEFDPSVAHLTVRDVTYRFHRDTRFSPDKSPYKRHFGAYIAAHGKKSFHGGYYLHLEPGQCMLACGTYYLPTKILTACRNEIMGNIQEWLRCVDNSAFINYFGKPGHHESKGFGLEFLKTCPSGFPRDYEHIDYLRMKDYCCWHNVSDDFFASDKWIDQIVELFKVGKPMIDFVNAVVDDYE